MNRLRKILSISLVLSSIGVFACDCDVHNDHDTVIQQAIKDYPYIFIGKVQKDENELWLEVTEVFKGELQPGQSLKLGFKNNSCAFHFGMEGTILIYGELDQNLLFANICSPTRYFVKPYLYPPPAPPVPRIKPNPEEEKEKWLRYQETEKIRLEYEVAQLRKTKY